MPVAEVNKAVMSNAGFLASAMDDRWRDWFFSSRMHFAMTGNPQSKRRPALRTIAQNFLIYGIAGAVIWYEIHGIPFHKLASSIATANLLWFVPATFLSLCIWFFGENLLYTRMFSYFHEETGYFEVMPATAASYFLQVVNILLAAGSLVLFLHRRKHTL
jgi:hypothetical protein